MNYPAMIGKWSLVVVLNAVSGIYWAMQMNQGPGWVAGMLLGIATFVLFYIGFDLLLLRRGLQRSSENLFVCALSRIPLQFFPYLDLCVGMGAVYIAAGTVGLNLDTWPQILSAYVLTLLVGTAHSVFVLVFALFGMISFVISR